MIQIVKHNPKPPTLSMSEAGDTRTRVRHNCEVDSLIILLSSDLCKHLTELQGTYILLYLGFFLAYLLYWNSLNLSEIEFILAGHLVEVLLSHLSV